MLKRQYVTMSILAILISFTILSFSVPSCDADYAIWGNMFDGTAYHNGTDIRMPYADVRINITRASTAVIVSLDSEFHIVTNTTQNTTLAFVYPTAWGDEALHTEPPPTWGDGVTNDSYFMQIYGNGTLIDFTVIKYNNTILGGFTEDFLNNIFGTHVDYAVFDIELIANTTLVLSTVTGSIFSASMNRFDYYYIVGSARTFEGHTIERVHMHVVEEVPFMSKEFGPNESLTVVENGIETDAIWDLNITEFSDNTVRFQADVVIQGNDWLSTLYTTFPFVFVIFLVYQFGYKKSQKIKKEKEDIIHPY